MVTSAIPPGEGGGPIKRCAASRALRFVGAAREAFTEARIHPMSERPYSRRLYSRRVKLRLLSVQIRVLSGAIRYMCCTSKEEKTPATNLFDPPSAAVIRRHHLYPPRG